MTESTKKASIGDRLNLALEELGMTQNELARRLKIRQSTISALVSGKSQGSKHILEMAQEVGQDPNWLQKGEGEMRRHRPLRVNNDRVVQFKATPKRWQLSLAPDFKVDMRQIQVVGYVQGGAWLGTVELPPEDRFDIPMPIQSGFDGFVVQGLIVRGASMDLVYPHGSILAVVRFMDLGRDPRPGERVVAMRHRHGETEATVKEFQIGRDGVERLWPRSTHPDFQSPVPVRPLADEDDELQIAYLVIGCYRPEV